MLPKDFAQNQLNQIDEMLVETRDTIERAMRVEDYLVEQRLKWLGKIGTDPFLIGLPSLYVPEQRDAGNMAQPPILG